MATYPPVCCCCCCYCQQTGVWHEACCSLPVQLAVTDTRFYASSLRRERWWPAGGWLQGSRASFPPSPPPLSKAPCPSLSSSSAPHAVHQTAGHVPREPLRGMPAASIQQQSPHCERTRCCCCRRWVVAQTIDREAGLHHEVSACTHRPWMPPPLPSTHRSHHGLGA